MAGGDAAERCSAKAAAAASKRLRAETAVPRSTYVGTDGVHVRDDLAVLNGVGHGGAILVEMGNLANKADWAVLATSAGRASVAKALSNAAVDTLR